MKLEKLVNDNITISIIGMGKNVGKTTTLNYLLSKVYKNKKVGLTSIGRDGESFDLVTETSKPRIYIKAGTILATARRCLEESDFSVSILETTNINTPLGEIIITEALSDGFALLAGPSINSQIKEIVYLFQKYNVAVSLIDGTISRKTFADCFISEGIILATGAAYSSNMDIVVKDTKKFVDLFKLKKIENIEVEKLARKLIKEKVSIINNNLSVKYFNISTAIKSSKEIICKIDKDSRYLVLSGALTDDLLHSLIDNRKSFERLTIIIKNGTKCIFDNKIKDNLSKCNIDIKVLDESNLLCVTYNPTSPYNYKFESEEFEIALRKSLDIPVFNVLKEEK